MIDLATHNKKTYKMNNFQLSTCNSQLKNRLFPITVLFLACLFSTCKKDFSVNAPYEDFPIVMGLMNPADNTHYVKIYKSFVTENSAYDAAKDIHLYSYIDSIEVYMEERDEKNKLIRKIPFDTTTEIAKDAGIFAFPTQILYKTEAELNINYHYTLYAYNPYTKKMAHSSSIVLAGQVNIVSPSGTTLSIAEIPFSFKYVPTTNACMYEFAVTFYYSEMMKDRSTRQGEPIVWTLGQQSHQSSGILASPEAGGRFFFQRIAASIAADENVVSRHTDSIVLSVFTAETDWYLYLYANRPSSGINQNRLDYTNISAYDTESKEKKYALGIFSSRAVTSRMFRDLSLITGARDSLFYGRFTGHLKFTDNY